MNSYITYILKLFCIKLFLNVCNLKALYESRTLKIEVTRFIDEAVSCYTR